MRRILKVLTTTLILTCMLLSLRADNTNELLFYGFLLVADTIETIGGKE